MITSHKIKENSTSVIKHIFHWNSMFECIYFPNSSLISMKDTISAEISRAVTSDETYPVEDKALALAQLKERWYLRM